MRRIWLFTLMYGLCGGCTGAVLGPTERPADRPATGSPDGESEPTAPVTIPDVSECEGQPARAGEAPLRRLTRTEYNNTIRDLLGVTSEPASDFPGDEVSAGFDHNSRTAVAELTVEKYQRAAEQLAADAVGDLGSLVSCDPSSGRTCAEEFVRSFGLRAYRRPLESDEVELALGLFDIGEDFASGIRLVVQGMLQSPDFLYRPEFGSGEAGVSPLSPYELASRLSYFLWNSMPDEELFAAATAGALESPEQVSAQAERMLDDPKAAGMVQSFHRQWLQITLVGHLEKDGEIFPGAGRELQNAMRLETETFVDQVVRHGDGLLSTLFTADYTYANEPLAELYGASLDSSAGQSGLPDGFSRVQLDPEQRSGLLTHASVLAAHAYTNRTSPVHRGIFALEQVFCAEIPELPRGIAAPEVPSVDPDASSREQFAQHSTDPACFGCHQYIDPMGFAFEHYDGVGAYRTEEGNGIPIDASGELQLSDVDGPVESVLEVAQRASESPQVRQCMARQWSRFALGRHEDDSIACSISRVDRQFAESGGNVRQLILAIVGSDMFRFREL